ncbi:MAG: ribosome silencing factor [Planctomycetota bacterium]
MTGQPDLPASQGGAEPALQSFVEFVYSILDEKRATDVVWLDVRGVTDLADDFLIATVLNPRQGAAIVGACEKERKRRGVTRLGIEGEAGSSWVLIDYGDLIIHLFLPERRAYYALEHIWADAKRVR